VEPRFRRVQQSVPPTGNVLPGMPLEMVDSDDDDPPYRGGTRFGASRFDRPKGRWWRPAGTVGRVFLALGLLIVLGGIGSSIFLLKNFLSRDARFRIAGASNIQASGLTEVSRAEMLPVFGEDIGRNIFFIPLSERRKQLEQIPWVERATVMRLLPDQIRVAVVERQPVAFARQGQQFGLVDGNGVLLTMPAAMMAQRHFSFPVVTGIEAGDSAEVRKARMAVYMRLKTELDANNSKLSEQLSEIDLTDPEDARVLMPEQGSDILAHFGEDHFLERYQRYKAHIAEWRQQYPKLAAVDLRYEQQVVLKMTPDTNTVEPGTGDAAVGKTGNDKAASKDPVKKTAQTDPVSQAKTAPSQPASKKASQRNAAQTRSAAKNKIVKPAAKAGGKSTGKSKTVAKSAPLTSKEKAAKIKAQGKKRTVEAKRAVLNLNRRKSVPAAPSVTATAAEGQ
jgi:cell division protein FtsQ